MFVKFREKQKISNLQTYALFGDKRVSIPQDGLQKEASSPEMQGLLNALKLRTIESYDRRLTTIGCRYFFEYNYC